MDKLRLPAPRVPRLRALADHSSPDTKETKDHIVQKTDQDASQSRLSAVSAGYLTDPFARTFCAHETPRKFPLINRGTYVRTTALDLLVNTFLAGPAAVKQIVSFGAGSDTRYFRLSPSLREGLLYHEFDFPAVTGPKIAAILRNKLLPADALAVVDEAAGLLNAPALGYYIHPTDLRALKPSCEMPVGVDPRAPTLFLSECCLIYLAPDEADAIVKWATSDFTGSVGIAVYEPIGGDDAFGRVMIQNLASRGIVLKTLKKYSTLERQRMRFKMLGFTGGQDAADVYFVSENWIAEEEKERIARLEMLDEVEEWRMLARHYCIAWAWRGEGFEGWESAVPVQRD